MSEQTNNLLHLFSKLLANPRFMMALRMDMMREKLRNGGERNGARGLLVKLWERDGLTNAEIAELLDIKPSSVTAQVKQLEEQGLVERRQDENDGRVSRVFLTEAGREAQNKRRETHDELSNEIFDSLSADEQAALADSLQKLVDAGGDFTKDDFKKYFDPRAFEEMGNEFRKMGRQWKNDFRREMRDMHNPWNFGQNGRGGRGHGADGRPGFHGNDDDEKGWGDF